MRVRFESSQKMKLLQDRVKELERQLAQMSLQMQDAQSAVPASDTPGKKKFPSLMALRFVGSLRPAKGGPVSRRRALQISCRNAARSYWNTGSSSGPNAGSVVHAKNRDLAPRISPNTALSTAWRT